MSGEAVDHPDLVRKQVEPDEEVVGEYPPLPSTSWKDRLSGFASKMIGHPKATAAAGAVGVAAVALGATGHLDDAINLPGNAIEAVSPGVSSEYTTPKEVLNGSVDIKIAVGDEKLKGRREPNTSAPTVDWDDIKLVTTRFDQQNNMNVKDLVDPSVGFSIDNPLFVHAQNPDGGAKQERWIPVTAEDKEGKQFQVYVSVSEQTFPHINKNGTEYTNIKTQKLDGITAYAPAEPGKDLPSGELNHVRTLTPPAAAE